MKTCLNPRCQVTYIPDDSIFCPYCGQPVSAPLLYDGKGKESDEEGYLCVDIRQCKRVSGLGWDGEYEFSPGLPIGYSGFYAMFDEAETIQILIEEGEIDSIYITDLDPTNQDDYTLKVWRDEEIETSEQVTYFAIYKNDQQISDKQDRDRSDIVLEKEKEKLANIYMKEFQSFFGRSFEKMMEHAVEYEEDFNDTVKEQPKDKSVANTTIIDFLAGAFWTFILIFIILCILDDFNVIKIDEILEIINR